MLLSAFFVTCMLETTGVAKCEVYVTDMSEVATSAIDCTVRATQIQELAVAELIRENPELRAYRQESGCTTQLEAEQIAIAEYKLLRSKGMNVSIGRF